MSLLQEIQAAVTQDGSDLGSVLLKVRESLACRKPTSTSLWHVFYEIAGRETNVLDNISLRLPLARDAVKPAGHGPVPISSLLA